MNKKFEYVDDNPGAYFGMLIEGFDSTYASVMKQADSDAQKLRYSWEKDGEKSLFDTLSELGYESDYEDSPYMFKDADGGNTIVFDFRPINSFEDYVTYYVVDKDNRIPDGWTKTKLMIDFWKDKNESLKEDKNSFRNWIEKKVGKQMSNMRPTKIGYKHGRPYYAIDFTDGTSDDYFIDFDKEEIEKCESLTEDSDSNNDYLSKLKKEESELQSKITSIQQQYHYKGYMKDYKYKMASNRLKEVRQLIFKLEAESKNEKVLSKADVTRAIKKISGLETLKTTTSSVRGYRPVTGGSFKVDDGGLNNFTVYFYNNTDKIPEIIDELKKQGFKISYVQKSSFNVENTRSLNSLKNEALTEDKDEFLKKSVSKSDLYSALEYMYGFNKKEANDWIKKASNKMKQSVVDGWKGNAKKSALTDSLKEDKYFIVKSFYDGPHGFYGVIEDTSVIDNNGEYKKYRFNDREELKKFASELVSKGYKNQQGYTKDALLKEDKFVSRDKMSKKDRKELDNQKRNTWGNTNPVTRVQPNKKAYDRKRDKKIEDESLKESVLNESSDGWDESKLYDLSEILDEIYNLQYEVQNTIRGAYTNAHTYEELGYYVRNLGSNLMDVGDEIMEMEEEDGEDAD